MSITPLHFFRDAHHGSIRYGLSTYITDCGRFEFYKDHQCWIIYVGRVHNLDDIEQWYQWLDTTGLGNAEFSTRRAAVEALEAALNADDLMDCSQPTSWSDAVCI